MPANSLYCDFNATTPIAPEVYRAMEPFFTTHFANPSSPHHLGRIPSRAVREARRQIAALIGASDEAEVLFTSGATESNNAAIRSALALKPERKKVVVSAVEHSSIRKLCVQLKREGYQIREVVVDADGNLDFDDLRLALDQHTAIVSLMTANNETGVIFDVERAAKIVRPYGAFFHTDAVQAAGKIPLKMSESDIDFLSLSAHKFYGPKGIGVLFIRRATAFHPLIFGGSQERGRRAGTENVPAIAGMGAAAQLALQSFETESARLAELRDLFETEIMARIPNVRINGAGAQRLPNTSHMFFRDVHAEALLILLDQKGICAASGSACMSGAHDPSHVLMAMGRTEQEAFSGVRFSFGRTTTGEDIARLVSSLDESVTSLRRDPVARQASAAAALAGQ